MTIFGGIESHAETNNYNLENIKNYNLTKNDMKNLEDEINVKEVKSENKEHLNIKGETSDESFKLNYDLKQSGALSN
ncbi:hypothetical protein [Mammaliicoccus sp. Dog046]|uniref:hypothetical protein n=1 Tax=Mammaliicoccus sp. Dog046 TaxID=3034233 RepID=UPI002B259A06|nr:hypothetical protein [Mammaliicoccus sp. Dog046]WQK84400.1 hypothetical protein P3U32_07080 [Mammaliicoccus sp. Dog046]